MGKDGEDTNDTVWSHQNKQQFSTSAAGTLILLSSSSYPLADDSLPFELIIEILWRVPVKFLMTLKCVCKSWNSFISSDRKFARKHLLMSRMNPKLILNCRRHSPNFSHVVYPLCSFFSNSNGTIINGTHINYPLNSEHISTNIVGSCDGILCLTQSKYLIGNYIEPALWNPSTRKYKLLPYLDKTQAIDDYEFLNGYGHGETVYGFGYDHLIDKYKVVAVSMYICYHSYTIYKTQVKVHTSDTDSWRSIQDFPSVIFSPAQLQSGIFFNGTINWFILDPIDSNILLPIVSLDFGTESYNEILQPDYGAEMLALKMWVSRDCLCILARHVHHMASDIWLMKEYGNRESWTKLISVPDMRYNDHLFSIYKVIHISENDQVLLESKTIQSELVVYDPINSTLKIQDIENFNNLRQPEIYIESLISPCS